ncbi:hypothetical protein L5515_001590 [Caenorhabditis briggsae]|uniref:Protein CBR-GEI-17 n=1 Tax=Caenorhabditis briggsae TaxID=6238 RepID=A0AAE9DUY0_CAEBR|nr:hypothetical protein L3Y34_015512 [Caenorhabditis briggsae]UMM13185.1 hypothetical protein L5515_001590 [Caenorhabditis briggsae]
MDYNGPKMIGLHGATYPFPINNGLSPEDNQQICSTIFSLKQHIAQQICSALGNRKRMNKNEHQKFLLESLYSNQQAQTLYQTIHSLHANGVLKLEMPPKTSRAQKPYDRPPQMPNGSRQPYGTHHYPQNPQMHNMVQMASHHNGYPMGHMQAPVKIYADPFDTVRLPFFDVLNCLLQPIELQANNNNNKQNKMVACSFQTTPDQNNRLSTRADAITPRFEIQLRFFNITEPAAQQKDDFPVNCSVRINDQQVTLPNIIPTNKPNAEPKRPSRPVNITQYVQNYRGFKRDHNIVIDWLSDRRVYAAGVYFVHRLNSDILFQRLDSNNGKHRSISATKEEVMKKLSGGEDDIAMDQLVISLLDPLSKIRMKTPVRCEDCTHLQCFDLMSYLMMNEKKPTWQCPVCSGYCPYDRLIVDDYFLDMLAKVDKNMTEVELKVDGSYEVIKEEEGVCLSDDDDDDDVKPNVNTGPSSSNAVPENGGKKKKPVTETDIITLDDSDDEDLNRGSNGDRPKTPPPKKGNGAIEIITIDDSPPRPIAALAPQQPPMRQLSQQQLHNTAAPPSPAVLSAGHSPMGNGSTGVPTLQAAMDQIVERHTTQRMPHSSQSNLMQQAPVHMNYQHSYMNGQSSGPQTPTSQFGYTSMMPQPFQTQSGLIGRNNQMVHLQQQQHPSHQQHQQYQQHQQHPQHPQQQQGMMSPSYYSPQQIQNGSHLGPPRLIACPGPSNTSRLNFPTGHLVDNPPPPGVTVRNSRRPNSRVN